MRIFMLEAFRSLPEEGGCSGGPRTRWKLISVVLGLFWIMATAVTILGMAMIICTTSVVGEGHVNNKSVAEYGHILLMVGSLSNCCLIIGLTIYLLRSCFTSIKIKIRRNDPPPTYDAVMRDETPPPDYNQISSEMQQTTSISTNPPLPPPPYEEVLASSATTLQLETSRSLIPTPHIPIATTTTTTSNTTCLPTVVYMAATGTTSIVISSDGECTANSMAVS